jgi:hypothetical protein
VYPTQTDRATKHHESVGRRGPSRTSSRNLRSSHRPNL